jgi:hypothetical protein
MQDGRNIAILSKRFTQGYCAQHITHRQDDTIDGPEEPMNFILAFIESARQRIKFEVPSWVAYIPQQAVYPDITITDTEGASGMLKSQQYLMGTARPPADSIHFT